MSDTVKHVLPYLSVAQSQKEITHNYALAVIDILLSGIADSIQTTPPGSPVDGDVVLVGPSSTTGVFVGHENEIAFWLDEQGVWDFTAPINDQEIHVTSTSIRYRFKSATPAWVPLSGVYTPTLTNVTNISASTAYPLQFMVVGNVCTVSGKVRINAAAAGASELGVSLPIASAFTDDYECAGTGTSDSVADGPLWVKADATNDRASLQSVQSGTSYHYHYFTFTYLIK